MPETKSNNGPLGLGALSKKIRILVWGSSLLVTLGLSLYIGQLKNSDFLMLDPEKFPALSILNLMSAACLRLVGIRWLHVLAFLATMFVLLTLIFYLGILVSVSVMMN
jgi:hypothetical protein